MFQIKNYIDGELVAPFNGEYLDNVNPSTGKAYSLVPKSCREDVLSAIKGARRAFFKWSQTPSAQRIELIRKMARIIKSKASELARAESIDNGKPIKLASSVDIPRASSNLEFFADSMVQFSGECYPMDSVAVNYTLKEPLGVVTCISPWNLPLYLLTWKIAPALVTGNTVIAKPSELTPMTAYLLSEIAIEAGLPPGVLNIVHGTGDDLGEALTTSPEIAAVSFTGSTATGKIVAQNASPLFKKVSLEMGGKNPNIIFEDCRFEDALKTTLHAAFSNQGQICLCGSRILIQKSIYSKFREALIVKAKALRIGDPLDSQTQQGAVVSRPHYEKILSYLELVKKEGGNILCGGGSAHLEGKLREGYFIQPTVVDGLDNKCRVNQEEIFGPMATLIPFEDESHAIELANDTDYGLCASFWTRDSDRVLRMAQKIKAGIVWANSWMLRDLRIPFGGMKNSGVGREGGRDSLNFFTETKNVCIKKGDL